MLWIRAPRKTDMALLEVKNLHTYFHTRNGVVKAVRGVSYSLEKGETLGVVGESGSGKSVTHYSLLGLIPMPPGRIEQGEALFDGQDLLKMSNKELREIRGKRISMIFQDPMTCLNPYLRIRDQLTEALFVHQDISKEAANQKALEMLEEVGIQDAKNRINLYPHEFSGGMRQRVMIAMALITEPDLLIADEPTTALDVTVQAQILELIKREQTKRGMAVIYITHDLGVVAGVADKVNVMYAGRIVEQGLTDEVFYRPQHPYTEALLASIPAAHEKGETLYTIPGMPPNVSKEIHGCAFAPRCEFAIDVCRKDDMKLAPVAKQLSACVRKQGGQI